MIDKVKSKIYAFIYWQSSIGEFLNKWQDIRLFLKFKFDDLNKMSKKNLESHLTKEYHIIEKGLSMPSPRSGFGKPKINKLIKDTRVYIKNYGNTKYSVAVVSALNQYLDFNENKGEDLSSTFYKSVKDFLSEVNISNSKTGGTKELKLSEIESATAFDYNKFITTRVSVRDFSEELIAIEEIQKIIDLARNAPSVCNRQGWHVHAFNNRSDIDKVLQYQHGNRGFGDKLQALLIVTADLQGFTTLEGNQPYVDGGILSMSILMAIHSMNMGACAMNTCIPFTDEKLLKKMISIPESERLIMMIGVGKLKEKFNVPISIKKDVNEVLTIHQNI